MDRNTAIAKVQQGLGFRSDLATEIGAAMERAILEFEGPERTLPEFLIQEDVPLALTAGVSTVLLPAGFLRMVEYEGPSFFDLNEGRRFLPRQDFDSAEALIMPSGSGHPIGYALRKDSLKFYPTPSTDISLLWSYYKSSPMPNDGTATNEWLSHWPYLVIGRAGMFMAEDTQQVGAPSDAFQRFNNMYQDETRRWIGHVTNRDLDNAPPRMGSNY